MWLTSATRRVPAENVFFVEVESEVALLGGEGHVGVVDEAVRGIRAGECDEAVVERRAAVVCYEGVGDRRSVAGSGCGVAVAFVGHGC
jgi:hypothetical protein